MDMKRRKELLEAYRNRMPEKGVVQVCCTATGEVFFGLANDTTAEQNSLRTKLSGGGHPNKRLQELWKQYGPEGFELTVAKVLNYEDPTADYTKELQELREACLLQNPAAKKVWN